MCKVLRVKWMYATIIYQQGKQGEVGVDGDVGTFLDVKNKQGNEIAAEKLLSFKKRLVVVAEAPLAAV